MIDLKLVLLDKENMLLFLNSVQPHQLSFEQKEKLESQLKSLLLKLKHIYHLSFCGYYTIYVYQDSLYGNILKIHHEDLDDFGYLQDEIELCFHIEKNSKILYRIEDPCDVRKKWHKKTKLYYYDHQFYFYMIENMSQLELGQFLEFTEPCFQNTEEILNYGKVLDSW